jgi:hypothetical protein
MTSANTAAFHRFLLARRRPTRRTALKDFAREYFPGCKPDLVVSAWERFGEAMKSYPFSIPFLYNSPVNYTLAYPLRPGPLSGRPMGRSWQMDPRGDDLAPSLDPYSLADVIRGLGAVAQTWKGGVTLLERGLRSCTGDAARMELDNARVCYHVFRSAWNTYRAYRLRRHWTDAKLDAFRRIAANERANLEQVSTYVQRDPRFGYHSEPQAAMFDTTSIRRKMRQLGALL